jgi:hypothetical protein
MKQFQTPRKRQQPVSFFLSQSVFGILGVFCMTGVCSNGQATTDENLAKQVQQLTAAMTRTQAQLEQSQRDLEQLRNQLAAIQQQIAHRNSASSQAEQISAAVEEIREQQSLQESQIATHEQSKIESESKFPVKISGLVLLSGFVNTRQVDLPATPTVVAPGTGSTGATIRQTVLGLDARGPHLWNARSHADVRVDFYGASMSDGNSPAGTYAGGLLRLRTAHAALQWEHTEAFFSLDHAIVNPNNPTSLTAVAIPALAWSGNLWAWNPQVGITQDFSLSSSRRLRAQTALIDIANPPAIYNTNSTLAGTNFTSPSAVEQSRWPGVESRLALIGAEQESGLQVGLGGLFATHRTAGGKQFDSWAGLLDYRVPMTKYLEMSGSAYRGLALGGLGGGGYKDYVYYVSPSDPEKYYLRALDDVGGWLQLKARASDHLEFNFAFGTDQVPAGELRPYAGADSATYLNLARNRTFTGNFIYSPSAYLLFSLEYRRLNSSPVNGPTSAGDIIGIATGYRF